MTSPTRLPTSPILSDGSTVVLYPDQDGGSGSTDHGEHAPTVPDRPEPPSHLGPVGSLLILMGSPYRPPESIAPLTSSTPLGAF